MVDLVRLVFNLVIFTILISCKTTQNPQINENMTNRVIYINRDDEVINDDFLYNRYDIKRSVENFNTITSGSVSTSTVIDSDIWIGKLGGELLRYNLYTNEETKFLEDNYSIKDYSIKQIIEIESSIVALQSDRLVFVNKSTGELEIISLPNGISRASNTAEHNGIIYISTLGYGLWRYDLKQKSFSDINIRYNFISSILLNKDKLYLGTMKDGLVCYNLNENDFDSRLDYPISLFNKNILTMKLESETLWIGTSSNGLIKWNILNNSIEKYYTDKSVSSIFLSEEIDIVSFMGFGLYIEMLNNYTFESIDTILKTNNITTVNYFNKKIIVGNIKQGLLQQEISY